MYMGNETKLKWPTEEEIMKACRFKICRWYRFLPMAETPEQIRLVGLIITVFNEYGGFTPEISKKLGWKLERGNR